MLSASVFLTSRVAYRWLLYNVRLVMLPSGFYHLARNFKSLKPSSFSKFNVKPFVLRCRWTLRRKYVRVEGLLATPFFSFTNVLQWKKNTSFTSRFSLFFRANLHKVCFSYFVVCFAFSDFWSAIKMQNFHAFFISSVS